MPVAYSIRTDAFSWEDTADSLDEAIEMAFLGEGLGKIDDLPSLESKFSKYVGDGGWCKIYCDGDLIFSMGDN